MTPITSRRGFLKTVTVAAVTPLAAGLISKVAHSADLPHLEEADATAAALGFALNVSVFLLVKFTSPLTNNITGTAKACVQTLLAVAIYRNPISTANAFGIALVISGSALYSLIRYWELPPPSPSPPLPLSSNPPTRSP